MLRNAYVRLEIPYFSIVSVNRAYNRGDPKQGIKEDVEKWLIVLRAELNREIKHSQMLNIDGVVRMDITLYLPPSPLRKGRDPDTSNFRKIPQDCIAAALGVDDSIFCGTDYPIAEGDNIMLIELSWSYRSKQPDMPIQSTSKLAMGPLNHTIAQGLGLNKDDYCVGFGSAYCMRCELEWCPAEYTPEVYSNVPCKECNIISCPCKKGDEDYENRKERILLWWRSKQ